MSEITKDVIRQELENMREQGHKALELGELWTRVSGQATLEEMINAVTRDVFRDEETEKRMILKGRRLTIWETIWQRGAES